jgi:hypothetical protein
VATPLATIGREPFENETSVDTQCQKVLWLCTQEMLTPLCRDSFPSSSTTQPKTVSACAPAIIFADCEDGIRFSNDQHIEVNMFRKRRPP